MKTESVIEKKTTKKTTAKLHDPRPYLWHEDDTSTSMIGEFDGDGFVAGRGFSEVELLRKLSREQRTDYKQARREGFHPVLCIDLETGVVVLEMRQHK